MVPGHASLATNGQRIFGIRRMEAAVPIEHVILNALANLVLACGVLAPGKAESHSALGRLVDQEDVAHRHRARVRKSKRPRAEVDQPFDRLPELLGQDVPVSVLVRLVHSVPHSRMQPPDQLGFQVDLVDVSVLQQPLCLQHAEGKGISREIYILQAVQCRSGLTQGQKVNC